MKKTYAYLRVSTKEQHLDRQFESVNQYCKENNITIDERDIITDKQSGKDFNREGYQTLKNSLLRHGDTLIIKELDRLGRDMTMIKEEWQELQKKGVNIIVIENPILNTEGKTDLEKMLISNIVFELLSYMAEKERIKIKQRQAEGIALMQVDENGKRISSRPGKGAIGRPSITYPDNWSENYSNWKDESITAVKAMELLNLKKNSFYKLVNEYEVTYGITIKCSYDDQLKQKDRKVIYNNFKDKLYSKFSEKYKFSQPTNYGTYKICLGFTLIGMNDKKNEVRSLESEIKQLFGSNEEFNKFEVEISN